MAEAEARQKLRLAEGLARAADAAEGAINTHAQKQRAAGKRVEQAQAAAQAEADKARRVSDYVDLFTSPMLRHSERCSAADEAWPARP